MNFSLRAALPYNLFLIYKADQVYVRSDKNSEDFTR